MTFIHESPQWPHFIWDTETIAGPIADLRHRQGRHLGKMESLGFDLRQEAGLTALSSEIVTSSAIEGESLQTNEVRSSIARKLGLEVGGLTSSSRAVDGIVEMMLDATQNYACPLSPERLGNWHAALFPTGRTGMHPITVGTWRKDQQGPMQVVSGPVGKERVHFQAPKAGCLNDEMKQFLKWFNGPEENDPILDAAIAHLWFVTIHPFDDGNGRIARAITEMALARADQSAVRFYSMSLKLEEERSDYYLQLESAQRGSLNITPWLIWFFGCLDRALIAADDMLGHILRKAELWQKINTDSVNHRQRKVINLMLDQTWTGHLNTSKYARLTKCSNDTALRDIKELLDREILLQNEASGRSTSYRLAND